MLSHLHRLAPEAAYRAASSAALDRRNALGMLQGLADTATLLARNAKPLPAWRATGALDQAAELLHDAGRNSLPPTPPSSPPSPKPTRHSDNYSPT